MKNLTKGLLSLLVLGLFLSGCQSANKPNPTATPDAKPQGTRTEIAEAFVETLAKQDFDELKTAYSYDEAMSQALNQLESQLAPAMKQLGELSEIQTPSEIEQGEYIIVRLPVVFAVQSVCINVVFDQDDRIAGVNFTEYVAPSDTPALTLPDGASEQELTMTARDGKTLGGTLTLPAQTTAAPVVIFVHGSGPNDRDETLYGNTVFRDIAYQLAEQGIASFRYDKRTYLYGEEMADDTEMTVDEETINDAVDAVAWIKEQQGVDPDQVYVLGHSLGGLCMPRIAAETDVAGTIFMAAPVSDLATLMRSQYEHLAQFVSSDEEKAIYQAALSELDQLNNLDQLDPNTAVAGAYPAYWRDLLSYDPIQTAEAIDKPVLVLQGEEDYQVPMTEFERWKAAFGDRENWTFISYSGLSHLMMPGDYDANPNTYYMTKANVDPRVSEDIAEWIHSVSSAIK